MGKRHSKRGSKKGKSKKNRAKNNESNLSKEQSKQKNSDDEIAEIFFGTKQEQNSNANTKNISEGSVENTSEDASNKNETDAKDTTNNISDTTSADANQCYEEIKAKQQELLDNLKNLNDAISSITLTRDNIASLRVEVLSNIYFTREVRPLIDAVNLIAFAASNMSTVAQNININTFGDRKEIKNAFKLCYKMNGEVEELLGALTRRIKLYVSEIDSMDRNCPPFNYKEDS
ncbi:hypothetical protein [Clostridium sp. YIM B02555]|uniref:hypothetical protein n=1 Tax=Clostridium sp. YIM B02555 TaxID=2911968 RepID=UPI001EEEF49C|nr:hypothetical protein [Clostridium sp. YIM B02555]